MFNPEHDISLAYWMPKYDLPEAIRFMKSDLKELPKWYSQPGGSPFAVDVWGWDLTVVNELINGGLNPELLPDLDYLNKVKEFSHRRFASEALKYIQKHISYTTSIRPAEELKSIEEVERFALSTRDIIFKSPYSGSGRGLFWSVGDLTKSIRGWCKRTIQKHGCVMGEEVLNKIQDFAMEFEIGEDGQARFCGYSVFNTEGRGIYKNSLLASDDNLEMLLTEWLDYELIFEVRQLYEAFLTEKIGHFYRGVLGVDMLVYVDEKEDYKLYPAVEINLRMTMGVVTRRLFDRFIDREARGSYFIEYSEEPGELLARDIKDKLNFPLKYDSIGLIQSGYMSLCPINENTRYRACINIGFDK